MKKIVAAFSILGVVVISIGADIRRPEESSIQNLPKKKCVGYTVIEFGKGIDCNGDTVRLTKVRGGQILAAQ